MAEKKDEKNECESEVSQKETGSTVVDLSDLYKFNTQDLSINISDEIYSNLSYMQVTHRDVYIDFLAMPGTKREGLQIVNGVRVFMSHVAAQKLAETLGQLLSDVHKKGAMETYSPSEGLKKIKTTTKVVRTSKEDIA
jgi:hypothetical protein